MCGPEINISLYIHIYGYYISTLTYLYVRVELLTHGKFNAALFSNSYTCLHSQKQCMNIPIVLHLFQ